MIFPLRFNHIVTFDSSIELSCPYKLLVAFATEDTIAWSSSFKEGEGVAEDVQ